MLLTDVRDCLLFLRQLAVGLDVKCSSSPCEKAVVLAPCHATSAQSFIKHDSWAGKLSHHHLSARLDGLGRARWRRPAVSALRKRRQEHVQHRLCVSRFDVNTCKTCIETRMDVFAICHIQYTCQYTCHVHTHKQGYSKRQRRHLSPSFWSAIQ